MARVCSESIQYRDRGAAAKATGPVHRAAAKAYLNDLCKFCGGRGSGS